MLVFVVGTLSTAEQVYRFLQNHCARESVASRFSYCVLCCDQLEWYRVWYARGCVIESMGQTGNNDD